MDERRVFLVFPGFEHLKNQPEEDQTCAPRPVETHPVQGQAGVLLSTNSAQCEEVSPGCQGCAGGPGGGGGSQHRDLHTNCSVFAIFLPHLCYYLLNTYFLNLGFSLKQF